MTGDERVRFRRAITLLLLTLVLPGSAQRAAGNPRLGKVAIGISLSTVGVAGVLTVVGMASPPLAVAAITTPYVLGAAQLVLVVLGTCWLGLFADAWRLGGPLELRLRQRRVVATVAVTLSVVVALSVVAATHIAGVAKVALEDIFAGRSASNPTDGRLNVLLLGGDAAPGRPGLRPDSLTLVSIDLETGRPALFGFPRNLQRVPFPRGSVMRREFPYGFECDDCLLNAVYTWANDHAHLFPPAASGRDLDPGVIATRGAIEEISGLPVHYHVLVDLRGFRRLVDALGGVVVDVKEPVPIGGDENEAPVGLIGKGRQRLSGQEALWYARSRAGSSDYDRMRRQREVLVAMLRQLDPATVPLRFQEIAEAGRDLLATDIPASELNTFVDLALKAKRQTVTTVQFVPPLITTADPDYDLIRAKVRQAIATPARTTG